jgi:hypothetical protein
MSKQERIKLLRRHVAEAQTEQTRIQSKLVNSALAPDDPQMATWRLRLAHWERVEREYRARLQRLLQEQD